MKHRIVQLLFILALSLSEPAFADGFFIDPQSAEGMGMAQAGAAVGYNDGSAGFYNPAALITYDTSILSLQLHGFNPSAKFKDEGSTVAGQANVGPNLANGGRDALLPLMYYATPLGKSLVGSLYINSPFGLGTEYPSDWIGRYQAVESSLREINVGSALGVSLGNGLSLGGGISAIRADASLSTAIDFGSIGSAALGQQNAARVGLIPQQADGLVKVEASDWSMGWNLGGLFRYGMKERNRIGIGYHGSSDLHFHNGDAKFTIPQSAQILAASGLFANTGARADVTLPQSLTLGSGTHLSDRWVLFQQSTWTQWSKTKDLTVRFENPLQPPSSVPQDWSDSWFHSVGLSYRATEQFEVKCGVAYENGIIPNNTRRYPRLPTSDSVWGSTGITIHLPESKARIDLSYTRVDYRGGAENSIGSTGDNLKGDWSVSTDALSSAVTFYW